MVSRVVEDDSEVGSLLSMVSRGVGMTVVGVTSKE